MPSTDSSWARLVVVTPVGKVFSTAMVSPISTIARVSFCGVVNARNGVSTVVNRGSGCGNIWYAAAVSI